MRLLLSKNSCNRLCCLRRNVETSCHNILSSFPATKKRRHLPATNVINSPWPVAAECIALAAPSVHSTPWSQILAQTRDFCLPHLHSTPPLWGSPSAYCHDVWYGKLEWFGYPMVKKLKKIVKIRLLVLTEYRNVSDRRTDGHRILA